MFRSRSDVAKEGVINEKMDSFADFMIGVLYCRVKFLTGKMNFLGKFMHEEQV